VGGLVPQLSDEGGNGGEVRGLTPAQGDEGLPAGTLDRATAKIPGVGKQDQPEQYRRRIRRSAGHARPLFTTMLGAVLRARR